MINYLHLLISTHRNKEMPTMEDGTLVYSNGLNGERKLLVYVSDQTAFVALTTEGNLNAVKWC